MLLIGALAFIAVARAATNDSALATERKHLAKIFRLVVNNLGKCDRCTMDEGRLSAVLTEAVKRNILEGLGLETPPVLSGPLLPIPLPARLNLATSYQPAQQSETEKTIVLAKGQGCSKENGEYELRLELPASLQAGDIVTAGLWMHTASGGPWAEHCHILYSYCSKSNDEMHLATHIQHSKFKDGWIEVDFTWVLKPWLEVRELCQNVVVKCSSPHSAECHWSSDAEHTPFLLVVARTTGTVARKKRNVDCKSGSTECCRADLLVSFPDIGWGGWIISPSTLNVHYCKGPCSKATAITSSELYAMVIERMKTQPHFDKSISPWCCGPTNTTSEPFLYRNSEKVVSMKLLKGIVIESCGCI